MILTCPECTTRYRFDDQRVPEAGLAVRCKRCRVVFRAQRPAAAAALAASPHAAPAPRRVGPSGQSVLQTAGRSAAAPQARTEPVRPAERPAVPRGSLRAESAPAVSPTGGAGASRGASGQPAAALAHPPPAAASSSPRSTAIPITVIPGTAGPGDEEIRRLTRIILSDIVIYSPERADGAIRDGRFPELYRSEIEEGRKMIRSRFAAAPAAVETYERALRELLESRRKELQESAGAL